MMDWINKLLGRNAPVKYPTMTELGLSLGDRVVWDCPDFVDYYDGEFKKGRHVHEGVISKDFSELKPTNSGELFVELSDGHMVSTLYLRKAG